MREVQNFLSHESSEGSMTREYWSLPNRICLCRKTGLHRRHKGTIFCLMMQIGKWERLHFNCLRFINSMQLIYGTCVFFSFIFIFFSIFLLLFSIFKTKISFLQLSVETFMIGFFTFFLILFSMLLFLFLSSIFISFDS